MTEHHSSRRAKQLKQDAKRSQKLRDENKNAGIPTTHVLNRAVVEGFFYEIARQRKAGTAADDIQILPKRVFRYALRVLSAKTNGTDQYDWEATKLALRNRMNRELSSPFRLDFLPKPRRDDITDET